jgi:glycosyltransferase involved in cell wall biosynthesis
VARTPVSHSNGILQSPFAEPSSPGSAVGAQLKSVCFVVSSPLQLKAWLDQIAALSQDYRLTCVANCDDPGWLRKRGIAVPLIDVRIERAPSPSRDIRALWTLRRFFKKNRFDVVHSVSPKAGLLAMTAAALAGVPVRIHTFTGQIWANRSGLARSILKAMDRWLAAMATHIVVDGEAQRAFLLREGVLSAAKSRVLGHGSVGGVDIERYRPNEQLRAETRLRHDVPASAVAFLYLGRIKRDKGILDLARAFSHLASAHEEAYLFIVGVDEDRLEPEVREICSHCVSRLRFVDFTETPEIWLAASDVLCLPSYREGFSMAILEAASTGLPSLGSRIYGIADIIDEGVTGLLHTPGDVHEIAAKMRIFAEDEGMRRSFGSAARQYTHRYFTREMVLAALLDFYRQTIAAVA